MGGEKAKCTTLHLHNREISTEQSIRVVWTGLEGNSTQAYGEGGGIQKTPVGAQMTLSETGRKNTPAVLIIRNHNIAITIQATVNEVERQRL